MRLSTRLYRCQRFIIVYSCLYKHMKAHERNALAKCRASIVLHCIALHHATAVGSQARLYVVHNVDSLAWRQDAEASFD